MDIICIQSYKDRNIYSHKPVIKADVDLKNYYDTPTNKIDRFNERLLQILPGVGGHFCSLGFEGGFSKRLAEGTYLGHVTEHMTLELQSVLGYDVHYGKSRATQKPSVYYIVIEYKNEKLAIECLLAAVDMVNTLIAGTLPDIDHVLKYLAEVASETDMGTSTGAIYEEARRRGIPVTFLDHSGVLQLGNGKYTRQMEASLTDRAGCIAVDIAGNKHLTKQLLSEAYIPVPQGDIAYTVRSASVIAGHIGYPVAVKPFNANQGKGVSTNISEIKSLEDAFHTAAKYSKAVIVEKHIPGRDYRLLVAGGKMVAASERKPPFVIGDGKLSIKQLVDMENKNPLRGTDHEKPLTVIKLDHMTRQVLAKEGCDENTILPEGKKVQLRYNGNLSTGGTAIDCTEQVHPFNAALAVKAAELVKLDVAGVDITCIDISQPLDCDNGAVIEVNAAPGLRMHIYPAEGQSRNVAADILDLMFPAGAPTGVPIVSVTGTNGKTTVARMIAYTLGLGGIIAGMTSTSGIYIGGDCILKGDNTGAMSAQMLLRDVRVEAAVLETARGGIIRRGLGYDVADVGVITNISTDHLGIDGIYTLEELAGVKALVVEAVKPDGTAVLNADDGMTPWFLQRISCKALLFSADFNNPLLQKEWKAGNRIVYVRDHSVFTAFGKIETFIARIAEIPVTYNGTALCNVENSLAAISSLLALGLPADSIRAGVTGFKPDVVTNPGRFNLFDMGKFTVMLDYGHNAAGYRAVTDMIRSVDATGYTAVIGMPGDRTDECIGEVGRLCGRFFSKLYIKEDDDLRDRDAGEAADILYDAAASELGKTDDITVIYSETKAFETAIMEAKPGELVVLFYEKLEPALNVIEKCRAMLMEEEPGKIGADVNDKSASLNNADEELQETVAG